MNKATFEIARLQKLAKRRRPTYLRECEDCRVKPFDTGTHWTFDEDSECYKDLLRKKRIGVKQQATVKKPVPRDKQNMGTIPDDFDPETEKRRMQQGGCCGSPSKE